MGERTAPETALLPLMRLVVPNVGPLRFPMRVGLALLLATASALTCSAARAQAHVSFEAIIHVGESYSHPIGHGLFFSIEQDDQVSWNFQVKPSRNSSESFISCLDSPVMHGPDTEDLLAWRFTPTAAGYAEHLPVHKDFSFVTTAADQTYECAEQSAMYDSFQRSQSSGSEESYNGLPHYKPRPQGKGEVKVESVKLKPGLRSKNAEFEQVTLHVSIQFPIRKRPTSAKPSGR